MIRCCGLILVGLLVSACDSNKLKKIVTPPDSVAGTTSSQGLTMSSSPTAIEDASSSSVMAASSANSEGASNSQGASSSTVSAAQSSNATTSSEASAFPPESSSSSSQPIADFGQATFGQLCASCHELSTQSPFQIGDNLSLAEMTQTIEQTMPFRHSESCIGSCAEELAYYITETLSVMNEAKMHEPLQR